MGVCQSAPASDSAPVAAAPVKAAAAAPKAGGGGGGGGAAAKAAPKKEGGGPSKSVNHIVIVSQRIPQDGKEDDIKNDFDECAKHMKNKLAAGLVGMYLFYDQSNPKVVHDVMIFQDADTIVKWADDMVKWPATRAGRPIQQWVYHYDQTAENWWTGVVFGTWNEGTKDRLAEMEAKLEWFKPSAGTGYMKPKVKKTKDKPVLMYSKRKLKGDIKAANAALDKLNAHLAEKVPAVMGIQQQADAKDKEVVHEFRALADSVAFKNHINTGDDKLKELYEAWHNCFDNEATPEGHIVTPDTDILNHDYVPKTPSYNWDKAEGEVGLLGK